MTIAVGILASDGVVVAADTQITSGDWKTRYGKIESFTWGLGRADHGGVLVAGAGTLSYVQAVMDELRPCMAPVAPVNELMTSVREALHAFYATHVLPFSSFPAGERPNIQLLMGIADPRGVRSLWSTEHSVVVDQSPFHAIGLGQSYATTILGRIVRYPLLDCAATAVLAGYVVSLVKESDVSCGKFTQIAAVVNGKCQLASFPVTKLIDEASEHFGDELEPFVLMRAMGVTDIPIQEALDQSPFREAVRRLRVEWNSSK